MDRGVYDSLAYPFVCSFTIEQKFFCPYKQKMDSLWPHVCTSIYMYIRLCQDAYTAYSFLQFFTQERPKGTPNSHYIYHDFDFSQNFSCGSVIQIYSAHMYMYVLLKAFAYFRILTLSHTEEFTESKQSTGTFQLGCRRSWPAAPLEPIYEAFYLCMQQLLIYSTHPQRVLLQLVSVYVCVCLSIYKMVAYVYSYTYVCVIFL